MENTSTVLKKILRLLNVPFTKGYLKDKVASHPEQESLLSISDTLNHYKVESLGLNLTIEKLEQIPLPCIIQIQENGHPFFSVLTNSEIDTVSYLDENGKIKSTSKENFAKFWTGVTLLLEKSDKSGEPGYKQRLREVLVFRSLLILLGLLSLIWLIAFFQPIFANPNQALVIFSLFLLKAMGLVISSVLLWSEIDKDNTAIQEFCKGGKNTDCNSVTSSFSLPGGISLSIIAFAYFFWSSLFAFHFIFQIRIAAAKLFELVWNSHNPYFHLLPMGKNQEVVPVVPLDLSCTDSRNPA